MAAVVTEPDFATPAAPGDSVRWTFPIEKREDTAEVNPLDGTPDILIWGKATDGSLDSDLQIVDPNWSRDALQKWFDSKGNVRMQHNAGMPVGRGVELDGLYVKSLICDPKAKYFVRKKILNDYSIQIINGDIRRVGDPAFRHLDPQAKAVGGYITGRPDGSSMIGELTICDRGANYGSSFVVAKSAGDGSLLLAGELTAPDDLLAEAAAAVKPPKTATVTLPANMGIRITPKSLAKLTTLTQQLTMQQAAARAGAEPAAAPGVLNKAAGAAPDSDDVLAKAAAATEAGIYKRDVSTAERRELRAQGRALDNLSYPIKTHEDADNAATLALSGHGNVAAAKKLIRRIARKEGWTDILDRLKGGAKKVAAGAAISKCMTCDDSGMKDGKDCPDCKPGTAEKKKKGKLRALCANCGAKQNPEHAHCPECGHALPARPVMVAKNHDFACLDCGRDLDKGEKFCPGCGRENPGHNPMADLKIPANKAAKERVGNKAKKGKKGSKGEPFGGNQAKPFGAKDDDDKDETSKSAVTKGKKKGGKGRSPAAGVKGHDTMGLPPHREPDGAPVEAFENDAMLQDGDQEMKTAFRHKASGLEPDLAVLHDLCCPAFSPAAVAKALPHATLASSVSTDFWMQKAMEAATTGDLATSQREYARMVGLNKAAVTLKTADPAVVLRTAEADHVAFLDANRDLIKTFTDATPGPGSAPTPAHVMPGSFRRPYISAGHAAESPQAEGARTFPVITNHPEAQDYQRGYLSAGHASQSPDNTGGSSPVPTGMAGAPQSRASDAIAMGAGDYAAARNAMHDHLSRIAPGMCPMSPPLGSTQKPAPQVPAAAGGPEPHSAKAAKPKPTKAEKAAVKAKRAAKAAAVKARKARKMARQEQRAVVKAATVPDPTPLAAAMAPVQPAPAEPLTATGFTPEALTEAVKAAVRPLVKAQKDQGKVIAKQRKLIDRLADQPDTTGAPYRGGMAVQNKTSAALAGPRTVAEAAELAQTTELKMLHEQWRNDPNPAVRENAYREITKRLGTNSVTHTPDTSHPFRT